MTTLDQMALVIGPPKYGKTTYVRGLILQHLTTHPTGIALVQDTNGDQFTDICRTYDTTAAYRAAVTEAAESKKPLPRGAAFRGFSSNSIRQLAIEIGERYNSADRVTVPIMLAYDEASMMESSGSTFIDKEDLQMIATRRHKGIAPIFNLQHGGIVTEAFYSTATDVIVFGQTNTDRVRQLEKRLGLDKGALEKLINAPKFIYAHWKQGEGLV